MFALGSGLEIRDYTQDISDSDILIRGMTRKSIIDECKTSGKNFYYMDGGYIGNNPSTINPNGYKLFHRIVKNNLQHSEIIDRPDDRWLRLGQDLSPWKTGNHILVVAPSDKPCKFYGINLQQWLTETITVIKKYSDRPIIVRMKLPRRERILKPLQADLHNAHAVVTYNSVAAVESVVAGVPVFTLAPTAADAVANKDLSNIENPYYSDYDLRYKWISHLAYGQYHIDEFKDGSAYKLMYEHS